MTTGLWKEIAASTVDRGTVALWWLYQSGIVLKSAGGTVVAIDAYLSEAAIRFYGVSRNVPAPLDADAAQPDAVLASHSHADHLDPDSIVQLLAGGGARFIGPPMAVDRVLTLGVEARQTRRIAPGGLEAIGDLRVRAVRARHAMTSEPTPDAVGFVVETDCGVRLYHSGDTEYDRATLGDTERMAASLLAINGTGGNMNAFEAALLAWQQRPRVAIPMHYGLWRDEDYGPGATIDPAVFVDAYRRLDPDAVTAVLEPATRVVLGADGLR